MAKIFGKLLHYLARGLSSVFNLLINLMNAIVMTFEGIRQLFVAVFIFGCSAFFFFPFLLIALPMEIWILLFVIIIIPILGPKFISFIRYANYTLTEWLFDKSESLITGKKVGYDSIYDYSNKYKEDAEKERIRKAKEEARAREEEMNRRFEEFFGGFSFGNFQDANWQNSYGQNSYSNMAYDVGFKEKFEKACDTLGLDYNTDIYQVKLNYRKLAKKYHPDINKEEGAKEKFQEINDAYAFLTEENINRYNKSFRG